MAEIIISANGLISECNWNTDVSSNEELRKMIYFDVSYCVRNGYVHNFIYLDGVRLYDARRDRIYLPAHLNRNTLLHPYSQEEMAEYDAIYTTPREAMIDNIVDTLMEAIL